MQELLAYLASVPAGLIADTATLKVLLASCWEQFEGSNAEGMAGYKLRGRMEDVVWHPPSLRFMIERHGATVLGSTRAARQEWNINIETHTAGCWNAGYKQVGARQARLDVRPSAEQVVRLIFSHQQDERLKWREDGSVWVQIGRVLPQGSAVKQTLAARRARFRAAVDLLLCKAGWRKVRPNVYTPPDI
jgi:hypothetical protein